MPQCPFSAESRSANVCPAASRNTSSTGASGPSEADAAVKTAAEKARKAGVVLAFLTAAALLASAAAAWWAARLGGKHRDRSVEFGLFRRR